MSEDKETWGDYGKLVLKEIERLSEGQEKMRIDMDAKFNELNQKINEFKSIEKSVINQSSWIDKVNDVWSPTQMKEAKDEIYKQKGRWIAAIAVVSVVQMIVGIGITIWVKMH